MRVTCLAACASWLVSCGSRESDVGDPTAEWTRVELTTDASKRQQQGGAIGDIDGDGRDDIVVGYNFWYRNDAADGRTWTPVPLLANGFDNEPLTHVGDMDGDGDTDVVMCTHFGANAGGARVAWAENQNGAGTSWVLYPIATGKSFTHAIVAADFDNDADLDVFVGQNVGEQWIPTILSSEPPSAIWNRETPARASISFASRRCGSVSKRPEARLYELGAARHRDIRWLAHEPR